MMTLTKRPFFTLGLALALSAFGAAETQAQQTRKLVSSWSQNIQHAMVFLKLDTPALFATATRDADGQLVIDQEQLKKVLAEQAELERALAEISPDIEVLYRYRFVMNGLAVVAPADHYDEILDLAPVQSIDQETIFNRPEMPMLTEQINQSIKKAMEGVTTTDFIGATRVHEEFNIKGQGIHVGILDTGVDYTHAMFGGPGTVEAFQSVKPTEPTPYFPNEKVVGGRDFAGDTYSPGSILTHLRIPKPDSNPIDISGHGTHVAGTVAGVGFDANSFDGVAPEARLHALKVFGPRGGTSDLIVMAAMEYAADPNEDLNPKDRLDVLNLSLGGVFGKATNNYQEAVNNLANAGMIVTASAGNSGPIPYVVGSPSTADAAFSIGASIDGMDKNWKFESIEYAFADGRTELTRIVEGNISLPVAQAQGIHGELVDVGLASTPFSDELSERVRGKVALATRGEVAFTVKFTNALAAGAIGVVMVNSEPGSPIAMGGEGNFPIPGVMVSQDFGNLIKAELQAGRPVVVDYDSGRFIEEDQLVDTLASFSSQGPRSEDGRLKPEIVAPGYMILSARAGGGTEIVPMNGTSMSAPQMAGVMALLKQAHPTLSVEELQAIAMNTAKPMVDTEGQIYSLSRQGAGRVQVYEAITTSLIAGPKAFSLGERRLPAPHEVLPIDLELKLTDIKNPLGSSPKAVRLAVESSLNMEFNLPTEALSIKNNSSISFQALLTQTGTKTQDRVVPHEAVIQVIDASSDELIARVPVLAIGLRGSEVELGNRRGNFLELRNDGPYIGEAWSYNLLARGERHPTPVRDIDSISTACNLMSAGYRISNDGLIDFGFEIDRPVTRWEACTAIILFSIKGGEGTNSEADLELVGASSFSMANVEGLQLPGEYNSLLFDAKQTRQIRGDYEQQILDGENAASPNYATAVQDARLMVVREHGRVANLSVSHQALTNALRTRGLEGNEVYYRVGILNNTNAAYMYSSFLFEGWQKMSLDPSAQSFVDLPKSTRVINSTPTRSLLKPGSGNGELLVLFPDNL